LAALGTAAVLLTLLAAPSVTAAEAPNAVTPMDPVAAPKPPGPPCTGAPGRVLVRFRSTAGVADKAAARAAVHGKRLRAYDLVPGLELVSTSLPVGRAVGRMRALTSVSEVQPDCLVHADQLPNDPDLDLQWGLRNTGQYVGGIAGKDIDAAAGWDIRTDASSVRVAVIDTGMRLDHPDLAPNLWTNPGEIPGNHIDDDHNGYVDDVHGWDFVNNDAIPADDNSHGSHVAGIIGARGNNGIGVSGVAWTVKLMPLKVLDATGNGSDSDIIAALQYAAANGARITNNSYGGDGFDQILYDAFVRAGNAGMLQVVAAGNAGTNNDVTPVSPASFRLSSVLSVAATDVADALASFSNRGATSVDLGAPGLGIYSTWNDGSYHYDSGTSMATPMVSGVAALVAAQNPTLSAAQLRDWIRTTVRADASLVGETVSGGVVDLGRALTAYGVTITLDPASDTGASTSDRITDAAALTFDVTFPRPVAGLSAADFTLDGTASGCVIGPPTGSGSLYQVQVSGCSAGSVGLALDGGTVVDANSVAGPQVTMGSLPVAVDRTSPTTTGLAVAPLTATNLSGSSIRLHVAWAGSDGAGGSGVARYQLQRSLDGGTTWSNVSSTLPGPVANLPAAPSGSVRYRVRAVDRAGNLGAWLTSARLSPRLIQNTSRAIVYSRGWTTSISTRYSGGSARDATVAGRSLSFTFTGRSIALVTTRATSRGQVKVYIDGVREATPSLTGSTVYRYVAWQQTWPTSARHTIRLVVVGTLGRPRIDFDAFAVLS
jgi:subtilisin family serine protease